MLTIIRLDMIISEHHPSASQTTFLWASEHEFKCAQESRVIGGDEEDQRCDEHGGVDRFTSFVALNEAAHSGIVAMLHDLVI